MTEKSLDIKLNKLHSDPHGCREFIIADAKDADMAWGVSAPGPRYHDGQSQGDRPTFRSLEEYRQQIRDVVGQGLIDIALMSASTNEHLTINERLFEDSHVTPAARANDTTDIHVVRGGVYTKVPSRPFATTTIDHIKCGQISCAMDRQVRGTNLGLYSVTFNNDPDADYQTLQQFKRFREEAERKEFRYFLEVFDPNVADAVDPETLGSYVNDQIVRCLGGVTGSARPLFLKMVYHGPRAMEELVNYDPHLIVGVLGGGAGTTFDAFNLLYEAKKYGARVALFGRKINFAEHQLAFVEFLRRIASDQLKPDEAVNAYHGVLQKLKIKPLRPLADDVQATDTSVSYGGSRARARVTAAPPGKNTGCQCNSKQPAAGQTDWPTLADGSPDFAHMTPAQKIAFGHAERNRILG